MKKSLFLFLLITLLTFKLPVAYALPNDWENFHSPTVDENSSYFSDNPVMFHPGNSGLTINRVPDGFMEEYVKNYANSEYHVSSDDVSNLGNKYCASFVNDNGNYSSGSTSSNGNILLLCSDYDVRVTSSGNLSVTAPTTYAITYENEKYLWKRYTSSSSVVQYDASRAYTKNGYKTFLYTANSSLYYLNYKLMLEYDTTSSDIKGFFYNRVGLNSNVELVIKYNSNNGILPVINNFKLMKKNNEDITFFEEDNSGVMVSCTTSDSSMICELAFDDRYDDLSTYLVYPIIENYSELDGSFQLYGNSSASGIGAYQTIVLENFNYYHIKESDSLVNIKDIMSDTSNVSYDIYIKEDIFKNLLFYNFNINNKSYGTRYSCESLNNGYCMINVKLDALEYLRVINKKGESYNFYSNASPNLLFSSVINGKVDLILPDDTQSSEIEIGTINPPDIDEEEHFGILSMLKEALDFFSPIIQFVFISMTNFYNSMPVNFRYFCILSFFIAIASIIIKSV